IVAAEHQRAGRGRAGRGWTAPPRASLAVSVLLRPGVAAAGWPAVPVTRWGWLPLLAGVALAESVAGPAGVTARLEWPNALPPARGRTAHTGARRAAGDLPGARRGPGHRPAAAAGGAAARHRGVVQGVAPPRR